MPLYSTNINNNAPSYAITDAKQAIALRQVSTPNYRYVVGRLMNFHQGYTEMEYDLSETGRILDVESIVASVFRKKRQMILKEGYTLASKNKENLEYIKQRLIEIEFVSCQSFRDLISEIIENMVNFNNCFVYKMRANNTSTGLMRTLPDGLEIRPIAGLFVLAAPTIDTANDPMGRIYRYRHRVGFHRIREFKPRDIFHLYENKRSGMTIGTPPLEAVKDDIIALRSIEQSLETMIARNASPFIHVKVGNDAHPARIHRDGTSEVESAGNVIEHMNEAGGVATKHNVDIKLLGSESLSLRLEGYLNHYKDRVFAGLSCSAIDVGIGGASTGGSASIVSQALKDDVRAYQETIAHFISDILFVELLLESPQYEGHFIIPEEDRVYISFLENDIDKRIKIESHYLNMFNSKLISQKAALEAMGRVEGDAAIVDLETGLPVSVHTDDVSRSTQIPLPAPKLDSDTIPNGSNRVSVANKSTKDLVKSIVNPTNQHTNKSIKVKDSLATDDIDKAIHYLHSYITDAGYNIKVYDPRVVSLYKKALEISQERGTDTAVEFLHEGIADICYDIQMEELDEV